MLNEYITNPIFIAFAMVLSIPVLIVVVIKRNQIYAFLFENKLFIPPPKPIIHVVDEEEVFPLKKYPFYDRHLYGPQELSYLIDYYSNKEASNENIMEYATRKYGSESNVLFKIEDKDRRPASIDVSDSDHDLCTKDSVRCDFFHPARKYYTPPCCAKNLSEILFYLHDLFEKHDVTYFIYWGTLLGAVRHGGIIPWDTDIDLYIDKKDLKKVKKLKSVIETETHFRFDFGKLLRLNYSDSNELHVDIYTYRRRKNKLEMQD